MSVLADSIGRMAPHQAYPPTNPVTPGGWLAAFRYRLETESGGRLSPEVLAKSLGVSGATVRRWETGISLPRATDLANFAGACRLSDAEHAFLLSAFHASAEEAAPHHSAFAALIAELGSTPYPAYAIDSFFFTRARNSYMDGVLGEQPEIRGRSLNMLRYLFLAISRSTDGAQRTLRENVFRRWLRQFWFTSASLCGTVAYREVMGIMLALPGFSQYWQGLATRPADYSGKLPGMPYPSFFSQLGRGSYRVYPITISLPPDYMVMEFVPQDEIAKQAVERMQQSGPAHRHGESEPPLVTRSRVTLVGRPFGLRLFALCRVGVGMQVLLRDQVAAGAALAPERAAAGLASQSAPGGGCRRSTRSGA